MNNIKNYKNKDVGILGTGLSGLAAAKVLLNSEANVFAFDDKKVKPSLLHKSMWLNYEKWPWNKLSTLVVSPSIPTKNKVKHRAIKLALKNNIEIINDIDLFVETKPKAKIIGITGTNGKSTTVALLHHILKFNKIKCVIGGNFGFPACEIIDPGEDGVIILELSSYHLDGTKKLTLDLASIINITPDHLEYHETFQKYKDCKLKLLDFLNDNGVIVFDENNKTLNKSIDIKKYKKIKFEKIRALNFKKITNHNIFLEGEHNCINASIAMSLAKNLKLNNDVIQLAINTYTGLPHRLEPLYTSENVKIINDSKSTNGESTAAALSAFKNIFWIVGGKPKIDGIGKAKLHLDKVIEAFLIGKSMSFFLKDISKYNEKIPLNKCRTLENAVNLAIKKAQSSKIKNYVILLSPSAASFDQFENFEDRGNKFKKIINDQLLEGAFQCL